MFHRTAFEAPEDGAMLEPAPKQCAMFLSVVLSCFACRPMPNTLVQATIRTDCLRHNVRTLQERAAPASLMAVLKADAYGHGVRAVAPLLQEEGVRAFAVARIQEAITLREMGIEGLILVLAPPTAAELSAYQHYQLHASVTSPAVANMLCAADLDVPLPVHVNVDTGMHRLGLGWKKTRGWWRRLHQAPSVVSTGIYTHLATADTPDHPLNGTQLRRFADTVDGLAPTPTVVHVANTDALTQLPDRLPSGTHHVRTGLGLYGLTSVPTSPRREGASSARVQPPVNDRFAPLRPVLSLHTQVLHLHTVPAGEAVSYGACWVASEDTCVATLGVGYGDGYPRLASGRASVRIHGTRRPMVGRVCMDLCMVDLGSPDGTLAQRTTVGDTVVLFDEQGPTIHDIACWSETIPYEICCQLAPRVPRQYCPHADSSIPQNGTI